MKYRKILAVSLMVLLGLTALNGQEEEGAFAFNMGIGLGVQTFNDGPDDTEISYQKIGLIPEFAIGKWGVALDLSFHFRSGTGNEFILFRQQDWVPDDNSFNSWLQLYLSKFVYLRYGHKGDPLYAHFGSIANATLGTGFIMGGYANTMFVPDQRLLGLALDVDGALVNFPLVGFESIVGNLAAWDVVGTRVYFRPFLLASDNTILQNMQAGITVAADRDPAYREEFFTELPYYSSDAKGNLTSSVEDVLLYGADIIQPLVSTDILNLAVFAAYAAQPGTGSNNKTATGEMIGVGGRLIKVIPYTAQIRFLGENFIPTFFDTTYDLYRGYKYAILSGAEEGAAASVGWLAASGFSLMEDMIAFNIMVEGPFGGIPTGDEDLKLTYAASEFPHLAMSFNLGEGLIPNISLSAYYDKKYIVSLSDTFHPVGAVIGAAINYRTGPAVITMGYDFRYNPATDKFDTSARLMTTISTN
ncbi:MAG: hypothetical protein JXA95_09360 [Spirochaetales bacterium]|nr:hypothetical protein [Spirochaetales bacterium]